MTAPTLQKIPINGYSLIRVQSNWTVCTSRDRLASFTTEEEARAYAFSLPAHMAKAAPAQ